MKKICIVFALVGLSFGSIATEPLLNQDYSKEFAKLSQLENLVLENQNLTLDSVIKEQPELLRELGINNDVKSSIGRDDPMKPAGFPAFWWGFCLGIWGILIVYLITDNDKSAINKTVKGCITAVAVYGGLTLISYLVILISAVTVSSD